MCTLPVTEALQLSTLAELVLKLLFQIQRLVTQALILAMILVLPCAGARGLARCVSVHQSPSSELQSELQLIHHQLGWVLSQPTHHLQALRGVHRFDTPSSLRQSCRASRACAPALWCAEWCSGTIGLLGRARHDDGRGGVLSGVTTLVGEPGLKHRSLLLGLALCTLRVSRRPPPVLVGDRVKPTARACCARAESGVIGATPAAQCGGEGV